MGGRLMVFEMDLEIPMEDFSKELIGKRKLKSFEVIDKLCEQYKVTPNFDIYDRFISMYIDKLILANAVLFMKCELKIEILKHLPNDLKSIRIQVILNKQKLIKYKRSSDTSDEWVEKTIRKALQSTSIDYLNSHLREIYNIMKYYIHSKTYKQ